MRVVTISPQWTIRHRADQSLAPRVLEVPVGVHEHGGLSAACRAAGISYRHAWDLIRHGEALFGQPLMLMEYGKGSTLTALGERLVWANRRIAARLSPVLDSLASELGAEIGKALASPQVLLRVYASHGVAVRAVHSFLAAANVPTELRYFGNREAVASRHNGGCDVAGFHVPLGEFESAAITRYGPWLTPASQRIINFATRRQGLMVAAHNPKKIYTFKGLMRHGFRFINRQAGSGMR